MWDELRLYTRYVGISIRSQMQYRASFFSMAMAQALAIASEFFSVWVLFDRFGHLRGWSIGEVALFFGIINAAFALAEGVARGFDLFDRQVKSGDFDRLLVRPRSTVLQVAASEWQLMRVGRLSVGIVVLAVAASLLDIPWNPLKVSVLVLAVLCGACLFIGLFVLQATMCFWTTESIEVVNTVTYGGVEMGRYPLTICPRWFRMIFIAIIPLGCVTYFPALALLGRAPTLWLSWVYGLAPLIGLLFLALSLQVWQMGVRHYRSTGS